MTCAKLCKYSFYIPGLFTPLNVLDMDKIVCFGFGGLPLFEGIRWVCIMNFLGLNSRKGLLTYNHM